MEFKKDPKVGDGTFLKLKDGEQVIGVFRGSPREFFVKWQDNKSIECEEGTAKAKFRFRVNFILVNANGELTPKIWEGGPTFYNDLKALNFDYPLEKNMVKIHRKGSGMNDTEYTILPVPKGELTKEREEKLSAVKLHDLVSVDEDKSFAPHGPDSSEAIPF